MSLIILEATIDPAYRKAAETFNEMYEKLENGDAEGMRDMMRTSTERRKRFDKKEN